MQQFVPFEDDWDMLAQLQPESLRPYRPGLACAHRDDRQSPLPSRPMAAVALAGEEPCRPRSQPNPAY